ncbi:ribose 5-phosphate isomerase B [Candidatus Pacearchaeota archaeon]|nr:ribose 5-phosphate isomerase B [Candidatus Pacearchaeota archaeon]
MKEAKIIIGSDHAGFSAKEKLKRYLNMKGIEYEDVGALVFKKDDDYPKYAFAVAEKVVKDKISRGILICHTGTGMAIAANKVKGIRAAEAFDVYSAKMSRKDNDSNILSLHAYNLSYMEMEKIVSAWLNTPFSGKRRHERRIRQIQRYESIK